MTGRERLLALLHRQPVDRLSWTTLVDDTTRAVMPPEWRELPVLDFYRRLGCDLFLFGNYGLPAELHVPSPCVLACEGVTTTLQTLGDGTRVQTTRTPWGELTQASRGGHPVKHPVASRAELRTLSELWRHTVCQETEGMEAASARLDRALGDDGVFFPTLAPSPVQQLLELDLGLAGFYGLLQDHERDLRELLDHMHAVRCREYALVARRSPGAAVIAVENTSTAMLSPALYSKLSVPQLRDYADLCHAQGKRLILHMCGHLRDLLSALPATGFDAANAVTPPPVGNTTVEMALEAWGEDFPLLGAVFDPSVFQAPGGTAAAIHGALDRLYTPRVRRASHLLWAAADGLPTPVERFLAVRDWMAANGGPGGS